MEGCNSKKRKFNLEGCNSKKRKFNLRSQTKEIVFNVNKYFQQEKAHGEIFDDIKKGVLRTAKATNFSESTVHRIIKEGKENNTPMFQSPKKRDPVLTVTNFDSFDKDLLRRTILNFYVRKEIPTIINVTEEFKKKNEYTGCKESLRKVMHKIGFRYGRVDGRKFLLERDDIVTARTKFLRKMKQLRNENVENIIYLDETWVNQNYTVHKSWTDVNSPKANGPNPPTGKGSRLIILHAGSKKGFIPEAQLIFQAKNDGDYHQQMNSAVFENWFQTQLLPNIPKPSVIVMDNAPYHSRKINKPPTTADKKAVIREWLITNGVDCSESSLKAELLELVRKHTSATDNNYYFIDKITLENGHRIIRLPPYHCQYNPIELIWGQVKSYIGKKIILKWQT